EASAARAAAAAAAADRQAALAAYEAHAAARAGPATDWQPSRLSEAARGEPAPAGPGRRAASAASAALAGWQHARAWLLPPLAGNAGHYTLLGSTAFTLAVLAVLGPGLLRPFVPVGGPPAEVRVVAAPASAPAAEPVSAVGPAPAVATEPAATPAPANAVQPAPAAATATAAAVPPEPAPATQLAEVPTPPAERLRSASAPSAPARTLAPAQTRLRVFVSHPHQTTARLRTLLQQRGVALKVAFDGPAWLVDAEVPAGRRADLAAPLAELGLALPADGRLHLRLLQSD
ncbi:MAG: hypothetical protein RLZZ584_2117, partial [Pseudomonadota bacterium]